MQISKNIIEADYTVNVTVKGDGEDGKFIIKDSSNGDTLNYQIYKKSDETDTEVQPGGVVLTTKAGYTGEQALKFVLDLTEHEKAGSYSGNATFTATATKTTTTSN